MVARLVALSADCLAEHWAVQKVDCLAVETVVCLVETRVDCLDVQKVVH
jgi:hypothetical protein